MQQTATDVASVTLAEWQVHARLSPFNEFINFRDFVDLYARLFKAALDPESMRTLREETYPNLQRGWRQRLVPHASMFRNSATYTEYPDLASRDGSAAVLPDPDFFVRIVDVNPLAVYSGPPPRTYSQAAPPEIVGNWSQDDDDDVEMVDVSKQDEPEPLAPLAPLPPLPQQQVTITPLRAPAPAPSFTDVNALFA